MLSPSDNQDEDGLLDDLWTTFGIGQHGHTQQQQLSRGLLSPCIITSETEEDDFIIDLGPQHENVFSDFSHSEQEHDDNDFRLVPIGVNADMDGDATRFNGIVPSNTTTDEITASTHRNTSYLLAQPPPEFTKQLALHPSILNPDPSSVLTSYLLSQNNASNCLNHHQALFPYLPFANDPYLSGTLTPSPHESPKPSNQSDAVNAAYSFGLKSSGTTNRKSVSVNHNTSSSVSSQPMLMPPGNIDGTGIGIPSATTTMSHSPLLPPEFTLQRSQSELSLHSSSNHSHEQTVALTDVAPRITPATRLPKPVFDFSNIGSLVTHRSGDQIGLIGGDHPNFYLYPTAQTSNFVSARRGSTGSIPMEFHGLMGDTNNNNNNNSSALLSLGLNSSTSSLPDLDLLASRHNPGTKPSRGRPKKPKPSLPKVSPNERVESQVDDVHGLGTGGLVGVPGSTNYLDARKWTSSKKPVKIACVNCKRSCKKCDNGRPCKRCIRLGLSDTCVDAPRKQRKEKTFPAFHGASRNTSQSQGSSSLQLDTDDPETDSYAEGYSHVEEGYNNDLALNT